MNNSDTVDGHLVSSDSESEFVGATVEVWDADWPESVVPVETPVEDIHDLSEADEATVSRSHLGTDEPDETGQFSVSVSEEVPEEVFIRAFDADGTLLGTVVVEEYDPTTSVTVPVNESGLDIGWKAPAAGGAAVLGAGAAWLFTQADGDDSMTPDQPDWQPQIAAPLNPYTPPRHIYRQAQFLYTGDDPLQTGVEENTIEPDTVAVLRGRVSDRSGSPVEGVTVFVNNHPEYGRTETRQTGLFDMVVNGDSTLAVNFESDDHLPVQRKLTPRTVNYEMLPEIALVSTDSSPSTVAMNATVTQVARASPSDDAAGQRRPTLVFPPGTVARTSDGETLDELTIRITEYTVGDNGPEAMPRRLPPETAYTFALECSADEVQPTTAQSDAGTDGSESQGATTDSGNRTLQRAFADSNSGSVQFNQPVIQYVENFLGFPVGEPVPTGAVDRSDASWSAIDDGRIVEVLDVSSGRATLDVDGSGTPPSATTRRELGISDEERGAIADVYEPGTQLWRVPIPHFTPFDCNWPREEPDDAEPPPPPNDPIPRDWFSDGDADEGRCPAPGRGVGGNVGPDTDSSGGGR